MYLARYCCEQIYIVLKSEILINYYHTFKKSGYAKKNIYYPDRSYKNVIRHGEEWCECGAQIARGIGYEFGSRTN